MSLILFASACYHYRRDNIKGALKSYKKSLSVIKQAKDKTQLHLNIDEYQSMILHQINSIKDHNAFVPVKLPTHII